MQNSNFWFKLKRFRSNDFRSITIFFQIEFDHYTEVLSLCKYQ
jgi:hypothetical protein